MYKIGKCGKCMGDVIVCYYNHYNKTNEVVFCSICKADAIIPIKSVEKNGIEIISMNNVHQDVYFNHSP